MNFNKKVLKVEITGTAAILAIGFIFHELYKITGNTFVALICPVNESKWEHWKIVFWPMVIVSVFEYFILKQDITGFIFPLAVGIISFEAVTFGGIELYEAVAGKSHLAVHISTFVLGGIVGQAIKSILMTRFSYSNLLNVVALAIIAVHIAALTLFTFIPPQIEYFRDSITGKYGIP
ncbi:hypothetical protein SAMN02745751_02703 [Dethiosulfatibacter aminovorans DSM 17477]|uniref:Uncharacterized protein n=1 Tax=Dethiosulfatibacter aminovorans DSM 17477 TaxID=1121476 RepID=A0A1M6JTX3_9FIRM|nr:DUF6512 family protein [Dethiosulfatibacter aminovorans]SHJ50109.1 hypothetical protein SAMN02745751_02703 [Dethiosulfatibacter aminovorans DSM 17477]